ncbi:hypothetical protein R1sor_014284 [Riccia sorocarpa]|uniref:Uncharacterized protein n=1 Tax=Riccia sorocarpa TaxID=122646 RepID=A0ABD3H8Z1_9MARC
MVYRMNESGLTSIRPAGPGSSSARSKSGGLGGVDGQGMHSLRSKFSQQPKGVTKAWNKKFSRRSDTMWSQGMMSSSGVSYEPLRIRELRQENRIKTRRYFPKMKKRAPRAPRNTTSFIMRAKKSGGLSNLVSPSTPAILPTPFLSPASRYREGLIDEVKKEWGVDGYGSMNGLIRLRSTNDIDMDDNSGTCGSGSHAEEENHAQSVQQLEQRIDHDLSRFEMVYPTPSKPVHGSQLVVRVEELESQVAQLEDENLALKENLFLVQQELEETRQRLQSQGAGACGSDDDAEGETHPESDASCSDLRGGTSYGGSAKLCSQAKGQVGWFSIVLPLMSCSLLIAYLSCCSSISCFLTSINLHACLMLPVLSPVAGSLQWEVFLSVKPGLPRG